MRLYEYEAKELLRRVDILIPAGKRVASVAEARKAAGELGGRVVLKAQVLTGGRGKAGGIQFAQSPDQAAEKAKKLLDIKIKGFPVTSLLVESAQEVKQELYLGITIDRVNYKLVVIACAEGGVDIEEVARKRPKAVHKLPFDIDAPFYTFHGLNLARAIGLKGKLAQTFAGIARKLHKLFKQHEAKLLEINPLGLVEEDNLVALDARMSVDEDALFRHPELQELGVTEDRHEEGEMTERERKAMQEGIPYLDLDGYIGMFPGGAGFAIYAIDMIKDMGGESANFMDSGGGPSPERLAKMLMLLEENPKVKAIFGARFGGVSRCDDFARGVIMFLKTGKLSKPLVIRMTGNVWEEGMRIFEEEKKTHPEIFKNVEIYGIETPIEHIAERAIAFAKEVKES